MKELPYQVMLGAAVLCVRSREKGSCGRPWNIKKTCISFTKCMSFSMSIIYCSLFFLCRYDETAPTIEPAAKAMIIDGAQAASAKEMPLTALLSNAATGNAAQVAAKVIIAERNGLFLMFDIMFSPFLLIYESSFAGTCILCMSFISRFYLCYLYIRSASRISTQKTKKTLVFHHSSECYGYRPDLTYIFVHKAEKGRMIKINMTQTERRYKQ